MRRLLQRCGLVLAAVLLVGLLVALVLVVLVPLVYLLVTL